MKIKIINETSSGLPGDVEEAILCQHTAWAISDACDAYNLKVAEIEIEDGCKTYKVVEK